MSPTYDRYSTDTIPTAVSADCWQVHRPTLSVDTQPILSADTRPIVYRPTVGRGWLKWTWSQDAKVNIQCTWFRWKHPRRRLNLAAKEAICNPMKRIFSALNVLNSRNNFAQHHFRVWTFIYLKLKCTLDRVPITLASEFHST